jgi:hypothetical protein
MEGYGTVQAPQCNLINQFSAKRPGSGTMNALVARRDFRLTQMLVSGDRYV